MRNLSLPLFYLNIFLILFCSLTSSWPEESGIFKYADLGSSSLSMEIIPSGEVPIAGDGDFFGAGGGAVLRALMRLENRPMLYPLVETAYRYTPVKAETGMNILSAGTGLKVRYDLNPRMAVDASMTAGYAQAYLNPNMFTSDRESGGSGYIKAGLALMYELSPLIGVGGGLSYHTIFDLSKNLAFGAGLTVHLPFRSRTSLEILESGFPDIYPSLYQHYAVQPPGFIRVRNRERFPVSDVEIEFFLPDLMQKPAVLKYPGSIEAGEEKVLPVPLLLGESILSNAESQQVGGAIGLSYTLYGEAKKAEGKVPLMITSGNTIVWDDDRKAAAFITHRSPSIVNFATNALAQAENSRYPAVQKNVKAAMVLYAALVGRGMIYVKDPDSPYNEKMKQALLEDYLRFPVQTLQNRAGDCDDLSVLYAALLESLGIRTALVTVPGHIFIAFSLDLSEKEAKRFFTRTEDLIFMNNEAWLPVETTDLKGDFLRAWSTGADQWRRNSASESAELIEVHDAWKMYPPVPEIAAFRGELPFPEPESAAVYTAQMGRFINREFAPRAAQLEARLRANPDNISLRNNLAVLYARYGLLDEAEGALRKILEKRRYLPAMLNLANIYFLQGRYNAAETGYAEILAENPDNEKALLGLSRSQYNLGNIDAAEDTFTRLSRANTQLAEKFAYLSSGSQNTGRASSADAREEIVVWEEEE